MSNKEILDYINTLGIEMSVQFVPFSEVKDKKENAWRLDFNWRITLSRGEVSFTVPYSQACVPLPALLVVCDEQPRIEAHRHAKETGIFSFMSRQGEVKDIPVDPPKLIDVLWCLVADSVAMDYLDYEGWAREYGYDPDSRKGEKVYQTVIANSLLLTKMLGEEVLDKLQELYTDY